MVGRARECAGRLELQAGQPSREGHVRPRRHPHVRARRGADADLVVPLQPRRRGPEGVQGRGDGLRGVVVAADGVPVGAAM
eukprot:2798828-Pyramimonas_sp.AAC.1